MLKEFREFAVKGNMLDMAVGIIIGAAFGTVVSSLVNDILMPPIGMLLGDVDFSNLMLVLSEGSTPAPYATLAAAQEAGAVTLNVGLFINSLISFVIIALAVFFVVRGFNRLRSELEEAEEAPPAAPAEPPEDIKLLAEIRDLLSRQG